MIHFGTGGWRAIIGDEFTKQNIQILAKALSNMMKEQKVSDDGIIIGYDRRFLAKEAMRWLAEVFAYEGIKTSLVNKSCPTPVIMYLVQKQNRHYGLMVTASHNPAIYNGVKVFIKDGKDADIETTNEIEKYIAKIETPVNYLDYQEGIDKGLIEEIYPINEYIDFVLENIDSQAIRKANLRIVLDPMYGVSETAIKTIMIVCRCEIETIHGGHDTLFGGHMPAPDAFFMKELAAYVVTNSFDIGIATDGDADRIGIIDDTGRYLSANDILLLLYWYLIKYKNMSGPIVRNLCTSHVLDVLAQKLGYEAYEVPVGFKWITAKMQETGAIIGGESSGGMAIAGKVKGKDGVYAASLLVEMMAKTGKKISQIYDELIEMCGKTYLLERNYTFKKELKEKLIKHLMIDKNLPDFPYEIDHISYMDGLKVYFKNKAWICVRFSGTEPLLRIFAEAYDEQIVEDLCNIFKDYLNL